MVDETLSCIRAGVISLLQEKDYSSIQMMKINMNCSIPSPECGVSG